MKKLVIILLALSVVTAISATEYLVVNGTQTSTHVPFDNSGSNSQHVQIIYPRTVCTAAMGTYHHIAGLRFFSNSQIVLDDNFSVTIRMKTTTSNSIINMEDFTTEVPVFRGHGTLSSDGKSILFTFEKSRYFDLNLAANENIIVDISVKGLSGGGGDIAWLGNTSSSNNLSIYDNGSYQFTRSSFIPKTQFLVHERHTVQYQGSTYDIYNDGMLSAVLKQFVCANSSGISNVTFSPVRLNPDPDSLSCRSANLYQIPITIPKNVAGTVNDVSVTAVGNNAFASLVLTEDVAIAFGGISQIGDNPWMPNNCFNCTCGPFTMNLVFYSTLPTLVGSYFENIAGSQVAIDLLFNNNKEFDDTWSDAILAKFSDIGYISYPYQLTVYNAYGKLYFVHPGSVPFLSFDQLPYADRPLIVSLTDSAELHNDGANHVYSRMLDVSSTALSTERDITLSEDGKSFTAKVNDNERFSVTPRIHSLLLYGHGDPYLSTSQANIHLNNRNMFAGCDSVVFVYNGDNQVPYWEFIDDIGTTDALYTTADFVVHKQITTARSMSFSFPFDIDVSSLKVVNMLNGDTIPLLRGDYENPFSWFGYDPDREYLVVFRYDGVDMHTQVKSGTLLANHGYIYKILPAQNSTATVVADIRFSSGVTDPRPLYCSDCMQTISGLSYNGPSSNPGWNLIGNPNYCYISGAAYGNYITRFTENGYLQQAWFDDVAIPPFETVLFQTMQKSDSTGVDADIVFPDGYYSPNPYGNHSTRNTHAGLPRVVADRTDEVVALRMTSPDGTSDRVAVIDNSLARSEFAIYQDLSKLFNSRSQIYIHTDTVPTVFKSLNIRADSLCVVPLGFRMTEAGAYRISLDSATTLIGEAYLLNNSDGSRIRLNSAGANITFAAGEDTAGYSLLIVPSDIPAGLETVSQAFNAIDAYVTDGQLVVENIEEGSVVSIYDITGRLVHMSSVSGHFAYRFAARGVYVVTLRGATSASVKVVY